MSGLLAHLSVVPSVAGGGGDITTNLNGWWKFDENAGTDAFDSSGNNNTAALAGSPAPAWVAPGKIGVSMINLAGGTGVAYVNGSATMKGSAITIAAWIRASGLAAAYNTVIGCASSGAYFQIHVKSSGKLAMYFRPTGGNVSYDGTGTNTLSTATWYHVAATYSSSTGLIGYLNGAVDGTAGANGAMDGTAMGDFTIGDDNGTAGRNWQGDIDDGRFYVRALSALDITTLYAYT